MARTPVQTVTPEELLARLQQNVDRAKTVSTPTPGGVAPSSPALVQTPARAASTPYSNPAPATIERVQFQEPDKSPGLVPLSKLTSTNGVDGSGSKTTGDDSSSRSQTTLSVEDVNALKESIAADSGYLRNPFGDFDNVTYHWKFFMTPDVSTASALNSGEGADISANDVFSAIDGVAQRVIAETGVTTGFNIQDVRMEQIVGPNFQTRNTNTTKITVTLVEPLGTSLMEKIRNAAFDLRIKNYSKVFYYLELTFKAYDPDGNQADPTAALDVRNSSDVLPNGGRWLYQVQITNIDTQLDTSGSVYTLTCIPYSEGALEDEIMLFPALQRVEGKTIKEMLDSMKQSLNHLYDTLYGSGYLEFDFKTHPVRHSRFKDEDPGDWSIEPEDRDKNSMRGLSFDGLTTVQIAQGTAISDIIEYVFANTTKGQQIAKDVARINDVNEAPDKSTVARFRECVLFRVEPDVDITGWDASYQNYTRKVTFHIWAYASQAPVISDVQAEDATKPEVQVQMIAELRKKGFLRKRYDHYFTGKNTEVMRLDVKYNLAWSAVLPMVMGNRATVESVSDHATYNENVKKVRDSKQLIAELENKKNKLNEENLGENGLKSKMQDPNLSTDSRGEALTKLNQNLSNIAALDAQIAKARSDRDAAREAVSAADAQNDRKAGAAKGVSFVEDLHEEPAGSELPLQISFRQTDTRASTGVGMTPTYTSDRGFYGAILEQLYGPVTTALINVEVEIRGDPYWIGYSNLERKAYMRSRPPEMKTNDMMPNTQEGDCAFLLHFDYPFDISPDTGEPIIRKDSNTGRSLDTFNGIYRTVRVVHNFSHGLFTSTLSANRLPLIDIAKVLGYNGAVSTFEPQESSNQMTGRAASTQGGASGPVNPGVAPQASASVQGGAERKVAAILNNPSQAAVANQVYSIATGRGYSRAQAIGVVANGIAESSLNPKANVVDSNGYRSYGLFQLNGNGAGKGQNVTNMLTVTGNTNIILDEASRVGKKFLASTTPGQAAANFTREVERPKDPTGSKAAERAAIAEALAKSNFGQ